MHERRFNKNKTTLRSPERVARLEVERVVNLTVAGITAQSVLDIGTGTGLFAEAFAKRGLQVAGVDVKAEMIKTASQLVPQGIFRVAVAEALPYPDNSFDVVFMGVLLHEADDRLKALREACRVGRILVAVLEWPYREQEFGPPPAHRIKPEEMASLARQAGIGQVKKVVLTNTTLYLLTV
jgi:ubiquinone/menaquinone biosynthesis C-methylase UbiE